MKQLFVLTTFILFVFSSLWTKGLTAKDEPFRFHFKGGAPALGVIVKDADEDDLGRLNLKGGAEIVKVLPGSEAEKIDLREDDIIVQFNGRRVLDAEDLKDFIADLKETQDVEIVVVRDGKELTKTAHIVPGPEMGKRMRIKIDKGGGDVDIDVEKWLPPNLPFFPFEAMSRKGGYLGVVARDISDQLKKYFQVESGVLIEKVEEDSPAEQAGLQAGDVILKINDKKIEDFSDLIRVLNFYDPGDKVTVHYSRKGVVKLTKVTLGKKEPGKFERGLRLHQNMPEFYRNFRPDWRWFRSRERGGMDLDELMQNMAGNWFVL